MRPLTYPRPDGGNLFPCQMCPLLGHLRLGTTDHRHEQALSRVPRNNGRTVVTAFQHLFARREIKPAPRLLGVVTADTAPLQHRRNLASEERIVPGPRPAG